MKEKEVVAEQARRFKNLIEQAERYDMVIDVISYVFDVMGPVSSNKLNDLIYDGLEHFDL
jgi:hypothetical protein